MLRAEEKLTNSLHWHQRVGTQRDWVWRGWQTRYTYLRPALGQNQGAIAFPDSADKPITSATSSTPIILLHGFGASIGHWRQNLTQLAENHTVYALDLLGFGASQKAPVNYDVSLWVDQVYDFWLTFIKEPVVLAGNSIGSLICLAAAAAHPDMVAGTVMISLPDPSVRAEAVPGWLLPAIEAVESWFVSPLILRPLFALVRKPAVVRRWVGFAYANPEAITDELVEILAGPAGDRGAARAFCAVFKAVGSAQVGPGVKTILRNSTIPMLLIWGKQDRMIPPRFARPHQFVECNPQYVELVELDNAGHCPQDECPEQVNQAILNWMSRNFAARGKSQLQRC
ncbi:alpha/beta fold hydrolase [Lyngbya sp. CCAP 1446/10]|uniref:alpha/beta fold hydrolase n=1 Tax=Lyngbya sp. CCAP 1446/10 TaxID=439293 RepID=UPI00223704F7|nr:alpha/beta fold hydrolase [Lyngbya sp. CCAP 1446/10]MCW6053535.1 alpha/beta fold hydrolase [Lyngbya sp. CCAP 1446/10]